MAENDSPQPNYPYGPPPQAPQPSEAPQPEPSRYDEQAPRPEPSRYDEQAPQPSQAPQPNPFAAGPPQQHNQAEDNPFAGGPAAYNGGSPQHSDSSGRTDTPDRTDTRKDAATPEGAEASPSSSAVALGAGGSATGTKVAIAVFALLTIVALIAAAVLFTRGGNGGGQDPDPIAGGESPAASSSGEPDPEDPAAAADPASSEENVPGVDIPDDSTGSTGVSGYIMGIEVPTVLEDKIDPAIFNNAELNKTDSPIQPGQEYDLDLYTTESQLENPQELFENVNELTRDHCFSRVKITVGDVFGPSITVTPSCYQEINPDDWTNVLAMFGDLEWRTLGLNSGPGYEHEYFNVLLPEMSVEEFQTNYGQLQEPEGINVQAFFGDADSSATLLWEFTPEGVEQIG